MTALARVVCTCPSVPAQWDAWDTNGQYYYLRYRFGRGTVEQHPSPDPNTWNYSHDPVIAEFSDPDQPYAGDIELNEFLQRTCLQLAQGAVIVPWNEYVPLAQRTERDEEQLRRELDEFTA